MCISEATISYASHKKKAQNEHEAELEIELEKLGTKLSITRDENFYQIYIYMVDLVLKNLKTANGLFGQNGHYLQEVGVFVGFYFYSPIKRFSPHIYLCNNYYGITFAIPV